MPATAEGAAPRYGVPMWFPVPGSGAAAVVMRAPGLGTGNWVGAPSAALDTDGSIVLAYRLRMAGQRGAATVVARSPDGVRLTTVATLDKARFGAESLERPALVHLPDGRWRIYVCCATPGSKHWWIDALTADDPAGFADAPARTVFPGDHASVGMKDPVIRIVDGQWRAWICCHPLDVPDAEDRMITGYATSTDGLSWDWHGPVLTGRPGRWDARGARVTAVLADGRASYDGRSSAEENFSERTGLAVPYDGRHGGLRPIGDQPVVAVRYLDVLPLPGGDHRLYYEAPLSDGSHELRTELVSDPAPCRGI